MVTRNLDPYLDASQVVGELWQGAYPTAVPNLSKLIDVLVLCARELQPPPRVFPGIEIWYVPLYDRDYPLMPEEKVLAHIAAFHIRRSLDKGKSVLVTCNKGLNRSGLVSALSLMYPVDSALRGWPAIKTPGCLTSIQAIQLVRRARGQNALQNKHFLEHLVKSEDVCRIHRREGVGLRLVS